MILDKAIKTEQAKWDEALKAGDVYEMVKSTERRERLENIRNTIRKARAELKHLLLKVA